MTVDIIIQRRGHDAPGTQDIWPLLGAGGIQEWLNDRMNSPDLYISATAIEGWAQQVVAYRTQQVPALIWGAIALAEAEQLGRMGGDAAVDAYELVTAVRRVTAEAVREATRKAVQGVCIECGSAAAAGRAIGMSGPAVWKWLAKAAGGDSTDAKPA